MVTLLVDYFLSFFLRLTQLYTLCVWYVYIVPTTYCIEEVLAYISTFICVFAHQALIIQNTVPHRSMQRSGGDT